MGRELHQQIRTHGGERHTRANGRRGLESGTKSELTLWPQLEAQQQTNDHNTLAVLLTHIASPWPLVIDVNRAQSLTSPISNALVAHSCGLVGQFVGRWFVSKCAPKRQNVHSVRRQRCELVCIPSDWTAASKAANKRNETRIGPTLINHDPSRKLAQKACLAALWAG